MTAASATARLPNGLSAGRSRCGHCSRILKPIELVPIASFIFQRGRCGACGGKIDPVYLVSEAAAAAVAVSAYAVANQGQLGEALWLGWLLLLLSLIDYRYGLLPVPLNLALIASGLIVEAARVRAVPVDALFGGSLGIAVMGALSAGYLRLRKREGLGGGDILLAGGLGAWVGPIGLSYVLLGAAIGGILALCLSAAIKRDANILAREISFGPFLAAAGWGTYLVQAVGFG